METVMVVFRLDWEMAAVAESDHRMEAMMDEMTVTRNGFRRAAIA